MLTLPRPVFLLLSFLLVLGLYYPSLHGEPIWDDFHNIFRDPIITGDFSYWAIIKDYAWPVSVSMEKILFGIWENEYFYFHLVNLLLHFLNSYLLLKLLQKLDLPFPRFIFFLFLLHPSNVISVSWMVQLKTLLCFTFCISSFFFLLRAQEDKRFYGLSWISFLLSVLSKSASLPFSLVFLVYGYKKKGKSELIWIVPFLMMSAYSTYKVLSSEITTDANLQIEDKKFVAVEGNGPKVLPQVQKPEIPPTMSETFLKTFDGFKNRSIVFLKTSHYYFWQVVLPLNSYPVKGQIYEATGPLDFFHIIFLGVLIFLTWGTVAGLCLIAGYVMLSPFLNIFTAPYMTLTWVSEQHMYLALPFFLCFWMGLVAKWKFKYAQVIPVIFILFLSVQTFRAVAYYQNEIIFYSKSLEEDPHNIPIAYNLAVAYIKKNETINAMLVTGRMIETGNTNPEVRASKYFSYISELHGKLVNHNLQKP